MSRPRIVWKNIATKGYEKTRKKLTADAALSEVEGDRRGKSIGLASDYRQGCPSL